MATDDLLTGGELLQLYPAPTGATQALRGVDVVVRPGAVTAITGPSGSGKSSLLAILALRERPAGGDLRWRGRPVATLGRRDLHRIRRREIGWIAQVPGHCLFPQLTARRQLTQVARLRRVTPDPETALRALDLAARGGARLTAMSGGEQQRLAVAAAAVGPPALIVADEPTAELDDDTADLVLAHLRSCAAAGAGVVMATHDARAVAYADTVLHLSRGVLSGTTSQTGSGSSHALTIDGQGRLQLPADALALFPAGRAVVTVRDGHVELHPGAAP